MKQTEIMKDFNDFEEVLEKLELRMSEFGDDFGLGFWTEWARFREKYTGFDCHPGEDIE